MNFKSNFLCTNSTWGQLRSEESTPLDLQRPSRLFGVDSQVCSQLLDLGNILSCPSRVSGAEPQPELNLTHYKRQITHLVKGKMVGVGGLANI